MPDKLEDVKHGGVDCSHGKGKQRSSKTRRSLVPEQRTDESLPIPAFQPGTGQPCGKEGALIKFDKV